MRPLIPSRTASHSRSSGRVMTGSTIIMIFFPVRVFGSGFGALAGIEAAHEQRAEDRGVDFAPIERGGAQAKGDVIGRQRKGLVIVEEAAVEPVDALESRSGRHLSSRRKGWTQASENRRRHFAACNMRTNILAGRSSTSSANMQKTSRLMKCATLSES